MDKYIWVAMNLRVALEDKDLIYPSIIATYENKQVQEIRKIDEDKNYITYMVRGGDQGSPTGLFTDFHTFRKIKVFENSTNL